MTEFQLSYFKSWKMMLWKCCTQYASKFGKQKWPQDWEGQFSFQSQGKAVPKSAQTTALALISHASKMIVKVLQVRLQQYMNRELPDVQAGITKGKGTRDQIANIHWIIKSKRVPEKHLFLLYWICQSFWLCGSQWTVGNSEKDRNTRPPDLPLEKNICRSASNS